MPPFYRLVAGLRVRHLRACFARLARTAQNHLGAFDRCILRGGEAARKAVTLIGFLRSPITVSFLIALGLFMPEQSREIYRGFSEAPQDNLGAIIFGVILVTTLSLVLLAISVAILASLNTNYSTIFAMGLVVLTSSLPLGGLITGLFAARAGETSDSYRTDCNLSLAAALIGLLGVLVEMIAIYFVTRRPAIGKSLACLFAKPFFGIVPLVLVVGSTAGVYCGGTTIAPVVGPIAILAWFGVVLLITSGHLGLMSDIYGYPLLAIILVSALVFSLAGWNSNHQIRVLRGSEPTQVADFGQAFREWLDLRNDLEFYRNTSSAYPVYVVSAEGGGVYPPIMRRCCLHGCKTVVRDSRSMCLRSAGFREAV
jgi:hypothetical protein